MGRRRTFYLRPTWTRTIALLIEHDILVRACCTTCGEYKDIDLQALGERVGFDYDLWNRRPKCKITPGCHGHVILMHSGRGPLQNMRDRGFT